MQTGSRFVSQTDPDLFKWLPIWLQMKICWLRKLKARESDKMKLLLQDLSFHVGFKCQPLFNSQSCK